jgi:hypothetical protein
MSNLRVMCAAHNQLMAERTFGRNAINRLVQAKPDERRRE